MRPDPWEHARPAPPSRIDWLAVAAWLVALLAGAAVFAIGLAGVILFLIVFGE